MMRVGPAATAAAVLLAFHVPLAAVADTPINGIAIGTSIGALAAALGRPVTVASEDTGNRFVFPDRTTAYADDDGIVLAVEMQIGAAHLAVDGTPRSFTIGAYTTARADAELAGIAEFATPVLRSYRLEPRRDLVLSFGSASQRLERVTYGEPGQLARLGLLPGDPATKAVVYRAPRPRGSSGAAPGPGEPPAAAIYRVTVDRAGSVTGVDVAIASGEAADDAEAGRALLTERYQPATLDGRPIAATIFVTAPR